MHNINELRRVNKFYKLHNQNVSCSLTDFVEFYECNNEVQGALIIRQYQQLDIAYPLLRSLYVAENCRRRGIAHKLLFSALKSQTESIYLLCEENLTSFYQTFGFSLSNLEELELPKLFIREIKKGLKLMYFRPY